MIRQSFSKTILSVAFQLTLLSLTIDGWNAELLVTKWWKIVLRRFLCWCVIVPSSSKIPSSRKIWLVVGQVVFLSNNHGGPFHDRRWAKPASQTITNFGLCWMSTASVRSPVIVRVIDIITKRELSCLKIVSKPIRKFFPFDDRKVMVWLPVHS